MLFINSMYSQDAGCPILPTEFLQDISYLADSSSEILFYDLNLEVYNKLLRDFYKYDLLCYMAGGYTYSYADSNFVSLYEYRFEAFQTVELLLSLIYEKNIENELNNVCKEFGLPFNESLLIINNVKDILLQQAEQILNMNDKKIYINIPSVSAAFIALWFSSILRKCEPTLEIIGVGNQINIPEIANFALTYKLLNNVIQTYYINTNKIKFSNLLKMLDIGKLSEKYPNYYGLKIIPYKISSGCAAKCNFCTERLIWDCNGKISDKLKLFPIEESLETLTILTELCHLSGITFNDCTLDFRLMEYKKISEYIQENELMFSGSIRIDLLNNETIALLNKMNTTKLIIGLETLNQDSVVIYNKGDEKYALDSVEIISMLYNNGIIPQINIVLAHPYENENDVINSINTFLNFKNKLDNKKIACKFNLGEMIINYPSENYFRIIKDLDFEIKYHNISADMADVLSENQINALQAIPYKAIKNKQITDLTKNNIMLQAINNLSSDKALFKSTIYTESYHWKEYLNIWKKNDIFISIQDNKLKTHFCDIINELLLKSISINKDSNNGFYTFNIGELSIKQGKEKELVEILLTLYNLDLIYLGKLTCCKKILLS